MGESEWTVDTLKEYIERRFIDQEQSISAALLAAKEAVIKAEFATEKRFDAVNEFRAQLADQATTFLPRGEYQVQHDALGEKVETLAKSRDFGEGRSVGYGTVITYVLASSGIVGFLVWIISHKP